MKLPELGEGVLEAELVEWLVAPGDSVKRGDSVAEVLTDKAAISLPSPFTGEILELKASPGDAIKVGAAILRYQDGQQAATEEGPSEEPQPAQTAGPEVSGNGNEPRTSQPLTDATSTSASGIPARPKAAPSVRRKARELGIPLDSIRGSGPGGRVLVDDLTNAAKIGSTQDKRPAEATKSRTSTAGSDLIPGQVIPLRGLRRKIAEHMVRSKSEIPHYSFMDECDVTELVRMREQLKPKLAESGIRLTYLAFIVKAVAEALKEFPLINSSLDQAQQQIQLHADYHVGIAVATPQGLIVPVIKNADQRSLGETAKAIQTLGEQARNGAIQLDDLRGATFVVTSIGGIGGLISTPIINQPNVGIMGVGRVVRRPMYDDDGKIQPADLMYLSYSFDHRVVDGAIGAEFNNAVMRRLADPVNWLIPV